MLSQSPRRAEFGIWLALLLLGTCFAWRAQAEQEASKTDLNKPDLHKPEFTISGFTTIAAGKVLGGTHDSVVNQGYDCPCFISDYAQNGVYESKGLQLRPDSKLGVQARLASSDQRYSLTAQAVVRGSTASKPSLEWLYASAELDSHWTVQLGRKRIPLFQYSDVQDVGHALPWIHLPPQLYGWEVVNYNGASLSYRNNLGPWTLYTNAFAGSESVSDSGFWKIYNGKSAQTSTRWTNILGAEAKLSRGWFEMRGVYLQSHTQNKKIGIDTDFTQPKLQRIYGLGLNADFGAFFASAEFLKIDRKEDYGFDHSQLASVGYRLKKFTPILSYANYRQSLNDVSAIAEAHRTLSAVLRYDYSNTVAFKLQYDLWKDRAAPGFTSMHGDARLLTLSMDMVF